MLENSFFAFVESYLLKWVTLKLNWSVVRSPDWLLYTWKTRVIYSTEAYEYVHCETQKRLQRFMKKFLSLLWRSAFPVPMHRRRTTTIDGRRCNLYCPRTRAASPVPSGWKVLPVLIAILMVTGRSISVTVVSLCPVVPRRAGLSSIVTAT